MKLFKSISRQKDNSPKPYKEFWDWFLKEQGRFFKTVKNSHEIEQDFFDHLSPKLAEIRKGLFF